MARSNGIRLLAIDLDGTLLDSNKQLPDENRDALRRLAETGVAICLASGRVVGTIEPFRQLIGVGGPVVSCNGAFVVDEALREISHTSLPDSVRDFVLDYAEQKDMHVNVYCKDKVYFSREDEWGRIYRERVKYLVPEILNLDGMRRTTPTKILMMDEPEAIFRHRDELEGHLNGTSNVTISEPEYIEFLAPSVNKGVGVQRIAEHMGLDRSEVAAVGDWLNDLEMVQWAGFSGAVGNAADAVKEAATVVLPTNDEAGVAAFVRELLD